MMDHKVSTADARLQWAASFSEIRQGELGPTENIGLGMTA